MVLERGEVANSWRHERWDSLRLLTPNWLSRLPGLPYDGPDPDGYMSPPEVVDLIDRYAVGDRRTRAHADRRHVGAARRRRVRRADRAGPVHARTVVLASGACNRAVVPALAPACRTRSHS